MRRDLAPPTEVIDLHVLLLLLMMMMMVVAQREVLRGIQVFLGAGGEHSQLCSYEQIQSGKVKG